MSLVSHIRSYKSGDLEFFLFGIWWIWAIIFRKNALYRSKSVFFLNNNFKNNLLNFRSKFLSSKGGFFSILHFLFYFFPRFVDLYSHIKCDSKVIKHSENHQQINYSVSGGGVIQRNEYFLCQRPFQRWLAPRALPYSNKIPSMFLEGNLYASIFQGHNRRDLTPTA